MARLTWNAQGERFYETGVDRGVLYVGAEPGIPWVGLVEVSEDPSGADPRPYYLDGRKYLNLASLEEFEASISALHSPREFGPCEGAVSIQNGLIATQQPRVSFGFSYRTLIGNEVEGNDFGYKIHLVYNALASTAQRSNRSIGDSVELLTLTWAITTLPPSITNHRPTAHLIVDSRYTDPEVLIEVEDILYGDDSEASRLPTPDELIAIFTP